MAVKIPTFLASRLVALAILTGAGGAAYVANDAIQEQALSDQYVRTVAADPDTSAGVKVAMVLGHFYESSGKHIGTPYVDTNGAGRPLTVCNGITGKDVIAGKWYSPSACYQLEKGRYIAAERDAARLLTYWHEYNPLTQGTAIDFVHNKGPGALATSTARREANAGNLAGFCAQMPRWNKGTKNGVLVVLPGLQLRGDVNGELCAMKVQLV